MKLAYILSSTAGPFTTYPLNTLSGPIQLVQQVTLGSTAGPYTAFPANRPLTTWLANSVAMTGVEGFFSAIVDETLSPVWLIFASSTQPADKSLAVKIMDFTGSVGTSATGINPVMLQIENSGMPIVSATVVLSLSNTVIDWATTDAQGRVNFLANPGIYTVAVSASGYVSQVGVSVTVPLTSTPRLIQMVAKPIAPPDSCDVGSCGNAVSTTPVTALGVGCCNVDHNYGGLLNLAYRASDCLAIAGATIEVFNAISWAAGNTASSFALLSTVTTADGLWAAQFKLNDGNYVLRFEKPGQYGPDIYNLTVNCAANPATAFVPSPQSPFGM